VATKQKVSTVWNFCGSVVIAAVARSLRLVHVSS
jgi:hypothetical protein